MNQYYLKEILIYQPESGKFIWNVSRKGSKGIGKEAGTVTSKGYIDVCIDGKKYGLHRLAFLYMTGDIPTNVDHKNGNKSDNRWDNLRKASVRENAFNYRGRSTRSGYKNVYYDKRGIKKWFVLVFDQSGIKHHGGYFHTPEEAHLQACRMREEFHGEFTNHGLH